jgi:hypothetical protein
VTVGKKVTMQSVPGHLLVWSFEGGVENSIEIPFLGHQILPHPKSPERVFVFEKWGTHVAEVNIRSGQILGLIEAGEARRYFGHGAYSHDCKRIYATQMNDADEKGMISVIDVATHRQIAEFPSGGVYPHECRMHPTQDALYVMNLYARGCSRMTGETHEQFQANPDNGSILQLIDLNTGKVLRETKMKNTFSGYAHFDLLKSGAMVTGGVPDGDVPAPVAYIDAAGTPFPLEIPPQFDVRDFHSEALSILADERNSTVTITFPETDRIHVWDYRTRKHLHSIAFKAPKAVARSERQGVLLLTIGHEHRRTLEFLDDKVYSEQDSRFSSVPTANAIGSHFTRIVL